MDQAMIVVGISVVGVAACLFTGLHVRRGGHVGRSGDDLDGVVATVAAPDPILPTTAAGVAAPAAVPAVAAVVPAVVVAPVIAVPPSVERTPTVTVVRSGRRNSGASRFGAARPTPARALTH